MEGTATRVPLSAKSAKQTITLFSAPESEVVAANLAVRTLGIPYLGVCEKVFDEKLKLVFNEDNQSALQIIRSGKGDSGSGLVLECNQNSTT